MAAATAGPSRAFDGVDNPVMRRAVELPGFRGAGAVALQPPVLAHAHFVEQREGRQHDPVASDTGDPAGAGHRPTAPPHWHRLVARPARTAGATAPRPRRSHSSASAGSMQSRASMATIGSTSETISAANTPAGSGGWPAKVPFAPDQPLGLKRIERPAHATAAGPELGRKLTLRRMARRVATTFWSSEMPAASEGKRVSPAGGSFHDWQRTK